MASKTLLVIFAVTMAFALTTAMTLQDLTNDEIDDLLETLMQKRGENNADIMAMDNGMVEHEMEKRGRYTRCTNPANGAACVCDRRYGRNNPKRYTVCSGVGVGQ